MIAQGAARKSANLRHLAKEVLSQREWAESDAGWALLQELAGAGEPRADRAIVKHILTQDYWLKAHDVLPVIKAIIGNGNKDAIKRLAWWVFPRSEIAAAPWAVEQLRRVIKRGIALDVIKQLLKEDKVWKENSEQKALLEFLKEKSR
jgi:hypothetical protein